MIANNHDSGGRFVPGNSAAKGNPYAKAMSKLRIGLLESITSDDIESALQVLRDTMANGKPFEQLAAAKELLDRAVGKPLVMLEAELQQVETGRVDWAKYGTPEELSQVNRIREDILLRARSDVVPQLRIASDPGPGAD
jgi:hypothetical protein